MKRADACRVLCAIGSAWLAVGVLYGCAVGPEYEAPAITVAPSFVGVPAGAVADEPALAKWWTGFGDPMLDDLVTRARAHNLDVRISMANLRRARALYRLESYDLVPTVRGNAAYTNELMSEATALPGASRDAREVELFDAGFDASWELDFFGRVRHSVDAALANVQAVEAARLDVLVSVEAEIVRNYFELRGRQNQLAVARRNADVQTETLAITQSRLDGGKGTAFDVARSSALLNLTRSSIPTLENLIQKTIYRLAVLTGEQPSALVVDLANPRALPVQISLPSLGDPAALVRRRPDIRIAERTLALETARIGIATADLFPRVTFTGSIGLQADSVGSFGGSGSSTWQFGPRFSWAAFDLGRVRARIKAAGAKAEAALGNYERTVLEALEEIEASLVDYGQEQAKQRYLRTSAEASEQAVALAHQRYDAGVADFLSVLDAERTLLEAQDRLADSRTRTATALVAVYKALGGGVLLDDAALATQK